MDVNTALFYSLLYETIYIEQPKEFIVLSKEDYICLLQKALYSLKQSPHACFHVITEGLVDFNFKQSESDICIWIYKKANGKWIYIALHIDDFIIESENENDILKINCHISEQF